MFGDYVYSPEPNATGGPRILVVPRASPDGRPVLVIEILGSGPKPQASTSTARSRPAPRRTGSAATFDAGSTAATPAPEGQSLALTPSKRQPSSLLTKT